MSSSLSVKENMDFNPMVLYGWLVAKMWRKGHSLMPYMYWCVLHLLVTIENYKYILLVWNKMRRVLWKYHFLYYTKEYCGRISLCLYVNKRNSYKTYTMLEIKILHCDWTQQFDIHLIVGKSSVFKGNLIYFMFSRMVC